MQIILEFSFTLFLRSKARCGLGGTWKAGALLVSRVRLARSQDCALRLRVGSSGVAETPLFNNVRTIIVRWRPFLADGALVNQLQQDVPLGHLVVPDATLDSELQPVK